MGVGLLLKIMVLTSKHGVFDDPEGTLREAAAILGLGAAGVGQTEVLRDKSIIEEKLKKEQGRYETLLDMLQSLLSVVSYLNSVLAG